MVPDEKQNRSRSRLGTVVLMLVTVLLGTLGGGVLGGIAGYAIALNQQPDAFTGPQPSNVSVAPSEIAAPTIVPAVNSNAVIISDSDALVAAVEAVKPATVSVINQTGRGTGSGSGVVIDKAGYILTNNHVIEDAQELEIIFSHGGRVTAQVVGSSVEFDLAVLKIDAQDVPAVARFGDSSALKQGERLVAIGSALGVFGNTVTSGILSAHNRPLGSLRGLLQTDAAINQGNSGGPLINLQGEIVGINVAVLRGNFSGNIPEGLGFSIPSNTAQMVAQQLIQTGEVEVPFLGVSYEELNPQLSLEKNLPVVIGSYIEEVVRGTAADDAGLQVGDVILAVNDKMVDDAHPLAQLLLEHSVGDTVNLIIIRDTEELKLDVILGQRPTAR